VSGATNYTQLCVVARNEEGRQTEMARRQHYQQDSNYFGRRETIKRPETMLADCHSEAKGGSSTVSVTSSRGSPDAGIVIKVYI